MDYQKIEEDWEEMMQEKYRQYRKWLLSLNRDTHGNGILEQLDTKHGNKD